MSLLKKTFYSRFRQNNRLIKLMTVSVGTLFCGDKSQSLSILIFKCFFFSLVLQLLVDDSVQKIKKNLKGNYRNAFFQIDNNDFAHSELCVLVQNMVKSYFSFSASNPFILNSNCKNILFTQ